jgi:hypothetical protein
MLRRNNGAQQMLIFVIKVDWENPYRSRTRKCRLEIVPNRGRIAAKSGPRHLGALRPEEKMTERFVRNLQNLTKVSPLVWHNRGR